jgi:hypothetical protein
MNKKLLEFKNVFKEAFQTWLVLLKIMIPISIIIKVLSEFGLIKIIANILTPIMSIIGLPGEFGLVWATAITTNIYGSLLVFYTLSIENVYTVSQVTVLSTIILVAHAFPIELGIAKKAGNKIWFMFLLRFLCAFILGWILNIIFSIFNLYHDPVKILSFSNNYDNSIIGWITRDLKNYFLIFLIILILLSLIKILRDSGILNKFNTFLKPGLEKIGMSKEAAPIALIGITLGISYGGGLIIKESKDGILSKKDMFLSLSMMGLTHSLIEDTILMITIGASLVGILFGRIIFTIVVMIILIKFINIIPKSIFHRYFVNK